MISSSETGTAADAPAAEFDTLMRRLGIEVPADLRDGVLRGYRGLRAQADLLRAAAETATGATTEAADGRPTDG